MQVLILIVGIQYVSQLISLFYSGHRHLQPSVRGFSHEKEQVKLDQACEAARQIALKPRKSEIYQECRQKFKKSESVCKKEANAYNGNRINGAPLFYELPTCEKAFVFRKKHTDQ